MVNWVSGVNHAGGSQASDASCAFCHAATGTGGLGQSVTGAHDWTKKDIRNISEFDITLTTDTPARGYYVNGERPVISIALKDHFTQAVVVPNTVIEDPTLEGCIPVVGSEGTLCTVPRDGLFASANVYVTGPRAQRIPVLTRPARAKVTQQHRRTVGYERFVCCQQASASESGLRRLDDLLRCFPHIHGLRRR